MNSAVQGRGAVMPARSWWQRVMSCPYAWIAQTRAALYRNGSLSTKRLPRRVISVGNLTVGGTGKTPMVIWIVQHLLAQGRRVAVLSRGYRRRSRAPRVLVSDGHALRATPGEAGDEPFLIARRCPRAVVAVGADRHAVGQWVLERFAIDDFILDDGFQHLQLARDVNLLLVDATDVDGLAAVLPAGRLREPLPAAARASGIVLTRATEGPAILPVRTSLERALGRPVDPICVEFVPDELVHIMKGATLSPGAVRGQGVVAVSAVGNPASFVDTLTKLGFRVLDHLVYRDHHAYSAIDVSAVQRRAHACRADFVVTTEKDACKLAELLDPGDAWWAVRLQARVWNGEDRLTGLLVPPSEADRSARA